MDQSNTKVKIKEGLDQGLWIDRFLDTDISSQDDPGRTVTTDDLRFAYCEKTLTT